MPALLADTAGDRRTPDPAPTPTAAAVVEAVVADVAEAQSLGYTIVDLLPAARAAPPSTSANVSHWFRQLFALLPPAGKASLRPRGVQGLSGDDLAHTSTDYAEPWPVCANRGLLSVVAGRVRELRPAGDGGLTVRYETAGTLRSSRPGSSWTAGASPAWPKGPPGRTEPAAHRDRTRDETGRALAVNHDFAAAPGLFVLRPLFAGTAQGDDYIWFLENVPVIHGLAERVAHAAWRELGAATSPSQTTILPAGS